MFFVLGFIAVIIGLLCMWFAEEQMRYGSLQQTVGIGGLIVGALGMGSMLVSVLTLAWKHMP